jgi:hypothetical protein
MFVFDSFHGPTTEWVKADVNEVSNFVVIRGGMTKFSNLWMLSVISHSSLLSGSFTASG